MTTFANGSTQAWTIAKTAALVTGIGGGVSQWGLVTVPVCSGVCCAQVGFVALEAGVNVAAATFQFGVQCSDGRQCLTTIDAPLIRQ